MKWISSLVILFLPAWLLVLATGCQKDPEFSADPLAYIPSDASMVAAFNLKYLAEKASWSEIKAMDFYRNAGKEEADKLLAEMVFQPEAWGINPDKKMYLTTLINQDNPEETESCLIFSLKNEEDFRRHFSETASGIKAVEGFKVLEFAPGSVVSWNENIAILAIQTSGEQDFRENLKGILSTEPAQRMAANPDVKKALEKDHDFSAWLSSDQLAENPAAGMGLSLLGINPATLKSNYMHLYGDFDIDQITGHADFFINSDMGEKLIGRFFNHHIQTEFSGLPDKALIFAAAVALDPAGMNQFFKEHPQAGKYFDELLKNLGVSRKDLPKIFGGDLLITSFNTLEGDVPGFFAEASLTDKKKAIALLDLAARQGKIYKRQVNEYEMKANTGVYYAGGISGKILLHDDRLLFCTEEKLLEKIKNSPENIVADWKIKKDQAFFLRLDFNELNEWTELENEHFNSLELNVNSSGADFTIQTKDSGSHSLNLFLQILNELYRQGPEF